MWHQASDSSLTKELHAEIERISLTFKPDRALVHHYFVCNIRKRNNTYRKTFFGKNYARVKVYKIVGRLLIEEHDKFAVSKLPRKVLCARQIYH